MGNPRRPICAGRAAASSAALAAAQLAVAPAFAQNAATIAEADGTGKVAVEIVYYAEDATR